MKHIQEYRRSDLAKALSDRIAERSTKPVRLMEFCGGHTVTVFRYGLRQLMPETVQMVSGPGCPVCVTANADLDRAIAFARLPGVIVTTFGDMFKVPGSRGSLAQAKAEGSDIRMVYSTLDALQIAANNPDRQVVFLGIGFETTAPGVALSIKKARARKIPNYSVFSMNKYSPPIVAAILTSGEIRLDGLICPGHVSAITGSKAWEPGAEAFHIPCAVAGFEPVDILQAVAALVDQIEDGRAEVEISYKRGVTREGNTRAMELLDEVFAPGPADWRGVGVVPESGMTIREAFADFDADRRFQVDPGPTIEHKGCICGNILLGTATPLDCKLFRRVCSPVNPVGPCMVSSEGSCSAYYKYGEE